VIEMIKDKSKVEAYPWQERRRQKIYQRGLANVVLLRPLGNVTYFMPPYVISEDEIELMAKVAVDDAQLATKNN